MGSLYGVDNTGLITTAAGIILPSVGGTQTTLTYNGVEFIRFQMSGSVTPFVNFLVTFSRCGQNVTMQWQTFSVPVNVSGQQLVSAAPVPTRFLPTYSNNQIYFVYGFDSASATIPTNVSLAFVSGGNLVIAPSNLGNFNNNFCGIIQGSISYIITSDL